MFPFIKTKLHINDKSKYRLLTNYSMEASIEKKNNNDNKIKIE